MKETMKISTFTLRTSFILVFGLFLTTGLWAQWGKKKKNSPPPYEGYCEGLSDSERPWIAVLSFLNRTGRRFSNNYSNMSKGMSDKFMGRLHRTDCFKIPENSSEALAAVNKYIQESTTGDIDLNMAISAGKRAGASYLVLPSITYYNEANMSGLMWKADVELNIRIFNTQTSRIVYSGEFKASSTKIQALDVPNPGSYYRSKAMAAAIEKILDEATYDIAKNKKDMPPIVVETDPPTPTADCEWLKNGVSPRVMVIVPETHIQQSVPDPAGETEMIKHFREAGFNIVDSNSIRNREIVKKAKGDIKKVIALGLEYGADIIVIGEAFSHEVGRGSSGLQVCRARVEAKAIRINNGQIIAADGKHASGQDASSLIAGKKALATAGGQLADYFIQRICEQGAADSPETVQTSEILILNIPNFMQVRKLEDFIKNLSMVKGVSKNVTSSGDEFVARFQVKHAGSMDTLMDAILRGQTSMKLELKNYGDGKTELAVTE